MKTLILSCLAAAAALSFSACETDGDHQHHTSGDDHRDRTTTTTTEETTIRQPGSATTETRTIRSY